MVCMQVDVDKWAENEKYYCRRLRCCVSKVRPLIMLSMGIKLMKCCTVSRGKDEMAVMISGRSF